jgi:hypothetical protein
LRPNRVSRAADAISAEQWNTKSGANEWSAAELVAHLMIVERAGGADRITQKKAKPIPFLKRFHLSMWLAESQSIRRKSPAPLDHSLLRSKEEMLGGLRAARADLGVLRGDREKGFERVLLAPCVSGNVKRV